MKQAKNPDHIRQTILDAAAHEIHLHGFQAASLSRILAKTAQSRTVLKASADALIGYLQTLRS